MDTTINLLDLWELFKKRIRTILFFSVIGVVLAWIVTFFFLTPMYSSQTQIVASLPQQTNAGTSASDVNSNLQLMNTYKDLVTGDVVLKQVSDELKSDHNIDISVGQLKKEVSVSQPQNSLMLTIKATDEDPVNAKHVANTVSKVFKKNVHKYLNVEKISIVSKATTNRDKVSPRNSLNLLIGLVVGFLLGLAIAFISELMDTTVRDEKFITDELGLTILGRVSRMTPSELKASTNKNTHRKINSNNTPAERQLRSGRNL